MTMMNMMILFKLPEIPLKNSFMQLPVFQNQQF